ncbi:MAG: tetratricopeptide repeat protein [Alistipes sp.]|nr:tetratricopeptide repeat protein [Alistipes sp.]
MANEKVLNPEEETLGSAMSKTEVFFEENASKVMYALLVLLVLAAAVFGYKKLVSEPRVEKAAAMLSDAQYRFESTTPDFELALNGDANGAGFLDVIDQYGSTPAGNLAKHYAGICYLRLGELDKAAEYLAKYSSVRGIPGAVINAQNLGLQGDVAVDKGDYAAAVKFYDKAVAAADNNFTAPLYLRKAALALRAEGKNAEAEARLERILNEYPMSSDAREADKLLGTVE